MNDLIGLVSHDAGGAQLLSCWASAQHDNYLVCTEGPAQHIFIDNIVVGQRVDLDTILSSCSRIITSSSWQSNLEKKCIALARSNKIRVASYLDHWFDYRSRFTHSGRLVLPDELWVADEYALELARTSFPEASVIYKGNFYLGRIREEIAFKQHGLSSYKEHGIRILYVAENIDEHMLLHEQGKNAWGYNEKEGFKYFLEGLDVLDCDPESICIRPHPSHKESQLAWMQSMSPKVRILSGELSLVDDILANDLIVGMESMALVVGLLAGKKVISAIPPAGRKCILPHREILHMSDLIRDRSMTLK